MSSSSSESVEKQVSEKYPEDSEDSSSEEEINVYYHILFTRSINKKGQAKNWPRRNLKSIKVFKSLKIVFSKMQLRKALVTKMTKVLVINSNKIEVIYTV